MYKHLIHTIALLGFATVLPSAAQSHFISETCDTQEPAQEVVMLATADNNLATSYSGVTCAHCHEGQEGAPMSSYDFASDNNPNKQKARELLGLLTSASLREVAENFEAYGINPRLKPDTSELWDSLAADNLLAGNLNMAKQYFQKSLILNPNNQNAKRMLRKLK